MEKLLTKEEVMDRLGIKLPTLYGWISKKRIPYTKVGSKVLFPSGLIDKWIEKRTFVPKFLN